MGGTHSVVCNDIAQNIWQWPTSRNIWLSAAYVPGSENHGADFKYRHFEDNTDAKSFAMILYPLGRPVC